MAQTLLAWPLLPKRQMVVIFLTGARPGSPMLLSRKLLDIRRLLHLLSPETLQRCSHHLGPMQVGRKGARVHPREGMSTSFQHLFHVF